MTHVNALQAGQSSQGTSEPITPVLFHTMVHGWRDTAMLACRRGGNIVTAVKNHRDTAMLECRRVGDIVSAVNIYRDTAISPPFKSLHLHNRGAGWGLP